MHFELVGMRTMDLDPSYVPYLEALLAGRTVPIHLEDVVARRVRMAEARHLSGAAAVPADVTIETTSVVAPDGHRIPVRIYRPVVAVSGRLPGAICYLHGGGWMYGSAEQSDPTAIG